MRNLSSLSSARGCRRGAELRKSGRGVEEMGDHVVRITGLRWRRGNISNAAGLEIAVPISWRVASSEASLWRARLRIFGASCNEMPGMQMLEASIEA